jgi:lipoprotein-anchoring transpeptidase ErfK/SrfK
LLAGVVVALASFTASAAAPADPAIPAPVAACDPTVDATCPATPGDEILSNETTFTTWASVVSPSAVRSQPATSAAKVGTLRFNTEDGFPEIYIVLRERQVAGRTWDEVRLPMKPAGRTGWVQHEALDTLNRIDTQLVLNRATQRIRLFRDGRKVFDAPAGIGAAGTPTPAGHFWIREAFPVRGVGAYGPFAFGTSAYSSLTDWPGGGVVGMHGTNEPQLVPGRPSHGCIRLRNADILRLARLVSVGTPLLVQ